MNIKVNHTYGNIGDVYGQTNIVDWLEEILKCNQENKLTKSGFLPQEVCVHNIERVYDNNHRVLICGNKTDEYDNVMSWLKTLKEEELSVFDLYAIEANEKTNELNLYFKVY